VTLPMQGQVSIVTGAARGIGYAVALELARQGSHVVIVDIIDGADSAAEIERDAGGGVRALAKVADVRSPEQVQAVVDETVEELGRLDVLVNNAGTVGRIDLESMDDETWERDLATNLRGTYLFTKAAIYPHMRDAGYGRVVNVSSISGIMGGPFATGDGAGRSGPAYAASKGGVIAFTKWVAKEVGELGITVNTVAPGPIATPMTDDMTYSFAAQAIKRMGTPEDIAGAVGYLASPRTGFVTGETLKVCGGSAIG